MQSKIFDIATEKFLEIATSDTVRSQLTQALLGASPFAKDANLLCGTENPDGQKTLSFCAGDGACHVIHFIEITKGTTSQIRFLRAVSIRDTIQVEYYFASTGAFNYPVVSLHETGVNESSAAA